MAGRAPKDVEPTRRAAARSSGGSASTRSGTTARKSTASRGSGGQGRSSTAARSAVENRQKVPWHSKSERVRELFALVLIGIAVFLVVVLVAADKGGVVGRGVETASGLRLRPAGVPGSNGALAAGRDHGLRSQVLALLPVLGRIGVPSRTLPADGRERAAVRRTWGGTLRSSRVREAGRWAGRGSLRRLPEPDRRRRCGYRGLVGRSWWD